MAKIKANEEIFLGGEAYISPQDFPEMTPLGNFSCKDRKIIAEGQPGGGWFMSVAITVLVIVATSGLQRSVLWQIFTS